MSNLGLPEKPKANESSQFKILSIIECPRGCCHRLTFIRKFFQENKAIYIPAYRDTLATWTSLERCLWQGLPYMTTHDALQLKYDGLCAQNVEKRNIESLFCDLLSIRDCGWIDLIKELENMKEEEDPKLEQVTELYEYLKTLTEKMKDNELEELRDEFSNKALIYRPLGPVPSPKWHCVQGCLWSSSAKISGKVTLSEHYEDLESFFVNFLKVETLNLEIVYRELIRLGGSRNASAADTRDQIMVLNAFLMDIDPAEHPNATKLIEAKILPIRKPDQTVSLASAKTEFAIVDRTHLRDIFAAQVKTLDFSFDEVRRLGPFIKFLRQDRKRLSEMVREITTVGEGDKQPLQCRRRQIGPKAHALYRVAFHFDSPRLKTDGNDLYNMLRNAHVYTTEGISSELHLSQDGKDHCHIKERSDLHLREHGSQLEIFVSKKQKKQDFCYSSILNKHLFLWLMTNPITQISETLDSRGLLTVNKILNSRRSNLAQVLQEDGIATGDIEELDQHEESDDDSDEEGPEENETPSVSTTLSIQQTTHYRSEYNPDYNRAVFSDSVLDEGAVSPQTSSDSDTEHQTPTSPIEWRSPRASENDEADRPRYENLLRRVVTAARRSQFPARGSFDMSDMSSALPVFYGAADGYDGIFESHRFHSTSQLERDRKIGAAGELYVFELLKTLDLPNFSMHQWQSTIRHYAAAHPDYADIRQWSGRETSDLTYQDVQGDFTRLLIDSGYLDEELWGHRRPMYFLEVKTTTGPCNTPFFVSKGQYERIRNHKDTTDTVYIIIRVFQVGSDDVRARVYLNPARLADDGQLLFTAEKWSVVSS
ncbi:hypothetical protein N8I77_010611 [Diaporthe amygdali]|uniref:Protein NO VEIN C-terminal domain-containing protein n=1 Tax=Phomopsis amygdali TaxID=1214568 RepID=A0AAD9S8T9_PHOAM|nr:hypothetical protein N8I77_010611 [Diaporthe amygdali]